MLKRLVIVVLSAVAALLLVFVEGFLNPLIEPKFWRFSGRLVLVGISLLLLLFILTNRRLRGEFQIIWGWTWLLLIPLSFLAVNVACFTNPLGLSFGLPLLSLVAGAFATGFFEEVFLRGFAFSKAGNLTPRFTVLLTALVFGLCHLTHLSENAIQPVIGKVVVATIIGIAFGLIRIATGSIAWCVILHGAINATSPFADSDSERFGVIAPLTTIAAFLVGMVLVFTHPQMRSNKRIENND